MPADEQVASYVKEQFKKWDQNQDGTLDFVEFCHYMENIWTYSQSATETVQENFNFFLLKNSGFIFSLSQFILF